MSKVIAVIDKPKNCEQCPCFKIGMVYDLCKLAIKAKTYKEKGIPDWCPLREVPQKKEAKKFNPYEMHMAEYNKGFKTGYNACIDDILKGAEENEIN